ncbi:MAG: response regulator [Promethearchaeota archaeon]
MRILVVDDNERFLDFMRKNLTIDDHLVITATSGEEGLIKVREQNFDLILTDLKMEGMSGVDFATELRKNNIETITIVITGYGTINSAVEAMKAGCYDYMLKPFEYIDLSAKIKEVEDELHLRRSLTISKIVAKSAFEDYSELKIKEYPNPFLVLSDDQNLVNRLNIEGATSIWLSYTEKGENIIAPTKLNLLRNHVSNFVKTNEKGTIIFKGIRELLKRHNYVNFKQFVLYLQNEILSKEFILLFLAEERKESNDQYLELLFYDTLSTLSGQAFNNVIEVVSHSLRKEIINLLKLRGSLNFNKIMEELNIKRSSNLAFHLKKLTQETIVDKSESNYKLTDRGYYFADLISSLEKIGRSDPISQIKAFKIPAE